MENQYIVISVGGSLIVPDDIDTDFLSSFKTLITEEIDAGKRFCLICGGGKTARRYQDAAESVSAPTDEDLDWLGIHSTRLNGHLVRTIFHDIAHPVMITNPDEVLDVPKESPLIIASGYRPGASTDLRAVQIAKHTHAQKIINLSNIDYAYTSDPREDEHAEKIESISWTDFRALIPSEWDPGLSSPFDPIAAREAAAAGIEVAIINGSKLSEVEKYMRGEDFIGTRIY